MRAYLVCSMLLLFAGVAQGSIIRGDFRTESNLPNYRSGQALVYQHLNASVGEGPELTSGHFLMNPDSWGGGQVDISLDPSTYRLTLKSNDTWDFQTFDAYINNLSFDQDVRITGVRALADRLLTQFSTPTISFTGNSIHLRYDAGDNEFNFTSHEAVYQLEVEALGGTAPDLPVTHPQPDSPSLVPEPSTLLLLGLGLGGVGIFGRRFRKS